MPDERPRPPDGGLPAHDHLGRAQSLLRAMEHSASALQSLVSDVHAEVSHASHDRTTAAHENQVAALRREVEQLREALVSRSVIERAKGILMERLGLSEAQSFDLLSHTSQRGRRKLRDVAAEIARESPLTGPDSSDGEPRMLGVAAPALPTDSLAPLRAGSGTSTVAIALPSRHMDPGRLTDRTIDPEATAARAPARRSRNGRTQRPVGERGAEAGKSGSLGADRPAGVARTDERHDEDGIASAR